MKATGVLVILFIANCLADDFSDVKVDEKYIQPEDYVAQSPKYGAWAREPGPYDNAKAKAKGFIDGLKFYADNYQPFIDAGAKEGYHGRGEHLVNADYVIDKPDDFRTAFKHLANNCVKNDYSVPQEFRFDTVGVRSQKSAFKVQCYDHFDLYKLSVFPNMENCDAVNMTDLFNTDINLFNITDDINLFNITDDIGLISDDIGMTDLINTRNNIESIIKDNSITESTIKDDAYLNDSKASSLAKEIYAILVKHKNEIAKLKFDNANAEISKAAANMGADTVHFKDAIKHMFSMIEDGVRGITTECKKAIDNEKGYVLRFSTQHIGGLTEGAVPKTLPLFIMKSPEWMKKLDVIDLSGAYDFVDNMAASKKLYEQIMHEYSYWKVTERKIAIEAEERSTPFHPTLTGRRTTVAEDDFIALTAESAAGFLSLQMEDALKTGDTMVGTFKVIKPLVQWNFEITATDGKVDGQKPEDFMRNADKPGKEGKVTDSYVMYSMVTHLAYRKKGTCIVKLTPAAKIMKGRPQDTPQFNDKEGKELVPVHYRSSFVPAGSGL
jgi:hypothetical protein